MKKDYLYLVSLLAFMSTNVIADEHEWEITANVAYSSDYLFYGASQTNGGASVSGGFDLAIDNFFPGLYVGTWAASVEQGGTNDQASVELDFYGGVAGELSNGVAWDFGLWFYTYPSQDSDAGEEDFDYFEAYGNFGYSLDAPLKPSLNIGLYYSPEYFGSKNSSFYIPVGVDVSLPYDVGAYLSYGYFTVDTPNTSNYSHYGVGLTKTFWGVDADISWTGADSDCETFQDVDCGGVVFVVSKSF